MTEYYFLVSLLPSLEIGRVPGMAFPELKDFISMNVTPRDQRRISHFLRLLDMENLRAYWAEEPCDPRGTLSQDELASALVNGQWSANEPFPFYLQDYLAKYPSTEERLSYFPFLMSQFLSLEAEEEGFIKKFFTFQREMMWVLVGFRAKKLGRDVIAELQYEDISDPILMQIIAQKDAPTYEPPFEYKELKPIFEEYGNTPLDLHKALYEYQFNKIIELWGGSLFTLDRILNYMARLILCERWLELDGTKGIEVIDTIEREIR